MAACGYGIIGALGEVFFGPQLKIGSTLMKLKILEAFIIMGILLSLIFWRNPLYVRHIDAGQDLSVDLEKIYSPVSPYVQIRHMNLKDSGYYTVTKDQKVCSRYYFGQIGGRDCFVELSEKYLENFPANQRESLEDISLTVRLQRADKAIDLAASQLSMEPDAYVSEYDICPVAASAYNNNLISVYIYYALALLLAIGIFIEAVYGRALRHKNKYKRKTGGL